MNHAGRVRAHGPSARYWDLEVGFEMELGQKSLDISLLPRHLGDTGVLESNFGAAFRGMERILIALRATPLHTSRNLMAIAVHPRFQDFISSFRLE
jgi:hypothetical protein